MSINTEKYNALLAELRGRATLVAVSKTKPIEDILSLYKLGQRDFGENYVQELVDKAAQLPADIRWHFIGHLQSNKVKYIAPFVHLIHGIDSASLLNEINKQATKNNRIIECLLQVHIAKEETKFGFNEPELQQLKDIRNLTQLKIVGLMGMASFTKDSGLVTQEFAYLKTLYDKGVRLLPQKDAGIPIEYQNFQFSILSMGMSGDYTIALEQGSNMIRIGSLLFGERNYTQ